MYGGSNESQCRDRPHKKVADVWWWSLLKVHLY